MMIFISLLTTCSAVYVLHCDVSLYGTSRGKNDDVHYIVDQLQWCSDVQTVMSKQLGNLQSGVFLYQLFPSGAIFAVYKLANT